MDDRPEHAESSTIRSNSDPFFISGDAPNLAEAAEELAQLLRRPVAPVKMPSTEELEVRLVSEQALERMFDAESDASLHTNFLMLVAGTILGFLTNLATGTGFTWSRDVIAYVVVLALVTLLMAVLSVRSHRRAKVLKRQIGGRLGPEN